MATALDVFREYISIKAHFSRDDYDYFRYNGKTKGATLAALEKRNDQAFFHRLSKHDNFSNFLVANFLENNQIWVGELVVNHTAENIYRDWLRRQESISYVFGQDLKKLDDDFESNFRIENNDIPNVLLLFVQREICPETVVILFDLIDYWSYIEKQLSKNLVWSNVRLRLTKYRSFVKRDHPDFSRFRALIKSRFWTV